MASVRAEAVLQGNREVMHPRHGTKGLGPSTETPREEMSHRSNQGITRRQRDIEGAKETARNKQSLELLRGTQQKDLQASSRERSGVQIARERLNDLTTPSCTKLLEDLKLEVHAAAETPGKNATSSKTDMLPLGRHPKAVARNDKTDRPEHRAETKEPGPRQRKRTP